MTLDEVSTICQMRLRNVAKSLDPKYMVISINLGISDLYNRFNLKVKSEVISTSNDISMYEVRDPDCQMLITLYDNRGIELRRTDVLGSTEWQWKQVNFRSFLLNKPTDSSIVAVYKSAPKRVDENNQFIELPEAFIEALILYVVYMVSATTQPQSSATGHRQGSESDTARDAYENECVRLVMMGYKINLETERPPIQEKGYV